MSCVTTVADLGRNDRFLDVHQGPGGPHDYLTFVRASAPDADGLVWVWTEEYRKPFRWGAADGIDVVTGDDIAALMRMIAFEQNRLGVPTRPRFGFVARAAIVLAALTAWVLAGSFLFPWSDESGVPQSAVVVVGFLGIFLTGMGWCLRALDRAP